MPDPSPPPTPRGAESRQRIARTALALFAERGVRETTIRDIAAATGMAEGALYRHFPGKDALADALFTENYLRFAAELKALATAPQQPARQRLEAMVAWFVAAFDDDWQLFSYLLLSQGDRLGRLPPGVETPVTVLVDFLRDAQTEGAVPAASPDLQAAIVLGPVLQAATFALYGRLPRPLAPQGPALAASCWAALQAAAP